MIINELKVNSGIVVDIGRFKILRNDQRLYDIPVLSFVIIKKSEVSYICMCIQLHIAGHGNTCDSAKKEMFENVVGLLGSDSKFEESLFIDSATTDRLWDAYYAIQLYRTENGQKSDPDIDLIY